MDSAVVLALAKAEGFETYCLTFDYGQRHRLEVTSARRVAEALGAARHIIVPLDLRPFGGSALTDDIEVPKNRPLESIPMEIPATYVPARNTIFLSVALAWCEVLKAEDILIGVNSVDFSGYPDCRPLFIQRFERLARVATKAGVEGTAHYRIHAPLMNMSKAEIVKAGWAAGVDFSLTHSCYDPVAGSLACGRCDSCTLRRLGFQEAGIPDPTKYAQ
jgi:7-cyano-7-deazaguanine synthase